MCNLEKAVDYIVKMRKLDLVSKIPTKTRFNNIYVMEGVNTDSGNEEKYIIYDLTPPSIKFVFNNYDSCMEEEGLISVFLFENWDCETDIYYDCYYSLKGKDKKKLKTYFEEKISVYNELCDKIRLSITAAENYLEYPEQLISDLEYNPGFGYIYNVSLSEIKKLFNVTGTELFKKNVRKGLFNNATVGDLKKSFARYIYSYILSKLELEATLDSDVISELYGDIQIYSSDLEITEDNLKKFRPEYFWFYHNGITIFSYGDTNKINRSGNYIELDPSSVSVINGAQTLTNFYSVVADIKRLVPCIFNKQTDDIATINLWIDEACNKTIVKTIFIDGNVDFVKPITYGLNKQVPILNEHILADSKIVFRLNDILASENIQILKEGDYPIYEDGLGVVDFVKKYLVIEQQPGKSKNLRKKELEDLLGKALLKFEDLEFKDAYVKSIKFLIRLDAWWKRTREQRDEMYHEENDQVLNSYGKNYFGSFVVKKAFDKKKINILEIEGEIIAIYYNEFISEISKLEDSIDLSDFKKDDLYNMFCGLDNNDKFAKQDENIFESKRKSINEINKTDLKEYLNKNITSLYSVQPIISNYLKENSFDYIDFRVISRKNERCKESFPFSSSSFSEIYSNQDKLMTNYDDSKFKEEINKERLVFVIDRDENKVIIDIFVFENFTFANYNKEAKEVFEKTVNAFEEGEIIKLPKMSDKNFFHVRPKAKDVNDTFEFTNGELITKQTFWANKSTVDNIIETLHSI